MTDPFRYQLRVTSAYRPEQFTDVALAPDGALMATASSDRLVRVWEVGTGKLVYVLSGHEGVNVNSVAWSPDGKLLASGAGDKTVCLWERANGALWRKLIGHGEWIDRVQWSADGRQLASYSYSYDSYGSPLGKTCIWDIAGGQLLATKPEDRENKKGTPRSEQAGLVAKLSPSRSAIQIYDAISGERIRTIGGPSVWKVVWSPDATMLASQLADEVTDVWATATATLRHTFNENTGYGRLAWSVDGTRLATSGNDKDIRLWDTRIGAPLHRLRGHTDHVQCLAWSTDGRRLASSSNDCTVRIWDAERGTLLHTLSAPENHFSSLVGVRWSADGTRLVSVTTNSQLYVWDTDTGALMQAINETENFGPRDLAWSADGSLLAAASWVSKTKIWEATSGKLLHELDLKDCNAERAALSPADKLLFDMQAFRLVSVAFSPDQKLLVSGCQDGNVTVWSVETGVAFHRFATHLTAYELKEVAFVTARSQATAFGQTPYGEPAIAVTHFAF